MGNFDEFLKSIWRIFRRILRNFYSIVNKSVKSDKSAVFTFKIKIVQDTKTHIRNSNLEKFTPYKKSTRKLCERKQIFLLFWKIYDLKKYFVYKRNFALSEFLKIFRGKPLHIDSKFCAPI